MKKQITELLYRSWNETEALLPEFDASGTHFAVLVLLGILHGYNEPCIILNKRSRKVRQAGDLCFPGGRTELPFDRYLARLLLLPLTPLTRWPYWREFKKQNAENSRRISLLLAAGLREGFEEMGLNPLFVDFLGPYPPQQLSVFKRFIHPLVVWVNFQKRFRLNWEVEKLVAVPLSQFIESGRYAQACVISDHPDLPNSLCLQKRYPCIKLSHAGETEILWGVTYRVVTGFLKLIVGFTPPEIQTCSVLSHQLSEDYFFQKDMGKN